MAIPSLAMIPTGFKDGKLYSVLPESGAGDFSVTRGSGATRVNKDGLVESVGNNEPRLDYTDGGCPVLLTEPQSTNLLTYSEDFSQWSLSGGSAIANSTISPDGTPNAYAWTTNASGERIQKATTGFTIGNEYTFSVYIKADTNMNVAIGGISSDVVSVAVTTEWQRLEITQLASTSTRYPQLQNIGDSGNFYIWGAQVEEKSYSTSYIPTSGAIATRLADSLTGAGDSSTFNSTEGVLYAEISALVDTNVTRFISLSDGTTNNRVYIGFGSTPNSIQSNLKFNGSTQFSATHIVADTTSIHKVAVKYKANDITLWIDGVEVATDITSTMPIGLSSLQFTSGASGATFHGKTKDLRVYNTALTDAELTELTTI